MEKIVRGFVCDFILLKVKTDFGYAYDVCDRNAQYKKRNKYYCGLHVKKKEIFK